MLCIFNLISSDAIAGLIKSAATKKGGTNNLIESL